MPKHARRIRVGAFQFSGSGDPSRNLTALERGIRKAARHGIRLLATQECGLCGYPPVEVASSSVINRDAQAQALEGLTCLARQYQMYIFFGMATFWNDAVFNTMALAGPDGRLRRPYHKRALYGWDVQNFTPGASDGVIHDIDGIRVGARICYEVRFPEYFRELFRRKADLAIVAFADGDGPKGTIDVIRSHLISRAAENAVHVLSSNTISRPQSAPTCLVDPDGNVVASAEPDTESLLVGEVEIRSPDFGRKGRILQSKRLCQRPQ